MDTRRAHTSPHAELLKLKKIIQGVGGISARERERERGSERELLDQLCRKSRCGRRREGEK